MTKKKALKDGQSVPSMKIESNDLHIKLNGLEALRDYCDREHITMKYYVQNAVKLQMKRDNII